MSFLYLLKPFSLPTKTFFSKVDEYLASQGKPKVFSRHFEGVFSDQKICQGCPHRYEREQTFMALNLTVKSNNLQESLDQVNPFLNLNEIKPVPNLQRSLFRLTLFATFVTYLIVGVS